jgi:carboxyl-terminal processing protease
VTLGIYTGKNIRLNKGMIMPMGRIHRLVGLLSAFLLSACALPYTSSPPPTESFARPAVADVIVAGFDNISDKYIETVTLNRIGVEGLRGLGAIDPAISLREEGDEIVLRDGGIEIGRMQHPEETDVRAWAAAVVALTEKARGHSPDIRKASAEKIYEAIFDGALSDLDIFSRYAGSAEATRNRAKRYGFGGLGIRFRIEHGIAVVTKVIKSTPAHESGLRQGDRILNINGTSIRGLKSREITRLIRGPVHTKVRLKLSRTESVQPFTVEVERAHIVPETVITKIEDGIAIIRISSFNHDTANAVERALNQLNAPNSPAVLGIVLDLRGNPGGLLRQSIKVADLMLTQGDILRTVGRHPESLHHYEAGGKDIASGLPLVVLVDGKSASAAEIVAAALQDRDRAVVVGTSSYGKGSVQTVIRLPNDGEITLTWSRFVAPSGYYLHGMGVVPTVCTSGKEELSQAAGIIEASLGAPEPEYSSIWRKRAFLSKDERRHLRENCPSEARRGGLDVEIAKRLILDGAAHQKALRQTTATAEAIN